MIPIATIIPIAITTIPMLMLFMLMMPIAALRLLGFPATAGFPTLTLFPTFAGDPGGAAIITIAITVAIIRPTATDHELNICACRSCGWCDGRNQAESR